MVFLKLKTITLQSSLRAADALTTEPADGWRSSNNLSEIPVLLMLRDLLLISVEQTFTCSLTVMVNFQNMGYISLLVL